LIWEPERCRQGDERNGFVRIKADTRASPFPDQEEMIMTRIFARSALLAGVVLAALGTAASAQTLGEALASGQLSEPAFLQLIAGTGLSEQEARQLTLDDVVAVRWQDD
jgi:hypothetical protein